MVIFLFPKKIKGQIIKVNKLQNDCKKKWDKNFIEKINFVVGDEWYAGNLSYHLKPRPITIIHKMTKPNFSGMIFIGDVFK